MANKTGTTKALKTWTWNWADGGYNSCFAATRAEALKIATAKGRAVPGGMIVNLIPLPSTLRVVSDKEMSDIDSNWTSLFL